MWKWKWSRSVVSDSLRPHGLQPTGLLRPQDFPGKSAGVDWHFLLQGIFPTQESNLGPLHCRQTLYRLSHQGGPNGTSEGGTWMTCSPHEKALEIWSNHIWFMPNGQNQVSRTFWYVLHVLWTFWTAPSMTKYQGSLGRTNCLLNFRSHCWTNICERMGKGRRNGYEELQASV